MVYNKASADLLTVGACNEIYRLNLGMGRFQSPLVSDSEELNCIDYSQSLDLLATGGIDGRLEFWDLNMKKKAHDMVLPSNCEGQEITRIRFHPQDL